MGLLRFFRRARWDDERARELEEDRKAESRQEALVRVDGGKFVSVHVGDEQAPAHALHFGRVEIALQRRHASGEHEAKADEEEANCGLHAAHPRAELPVPPGLCATFAGCGRAGAGSKRMT